MKHHVGLPRRQGLYDPALEHDACGVGFLANIRGEKSHAVVHKGIVALERLEHRGACGCDPETGDGAGILIQIPDRFFRQEVAKFGVELPPSGRYASGKILLSFNEVESDRQIAKLEQIVTTIDAYTDVQDAADNNSADVSVGVTTNQQE